MPVALYLRVSTEEQRERQSIATQRDFAERYCALHHLTVVAIYADDGISGTVPLHQRPAGARIMPDARLHRFDHLLVYRLDRLGRDTRLTLQAVAELEECGVGVKSLTEEFDTATASGRLMLTLLSGFAAHEREIIRERSLAGSQRVASQGGWLGGTPPFGYRLASESGKPVLVWAEGPLPGLDLSAAEVIRRIFRMAAEEHQSCRRIADQLNALGVPCADPQQRSPKQPAASASRWRAGRVRNLLVSTVYKGQHQYGKRGRNRQGSVVSRPVPALVSETAWEQAQQTLHHNFRFGNRYCRHPYLLRGLVKCGRCGLTYIGMTAVSRSGRQTAYYRCNGKHDTRGVYGEMGKRCASKDVLGQWLEEAVWEEIEGMLRQPEEALARLQQRLAQEQKGMAGWRARMAKLRQAQERKSGERDRVLHLYRTGRIGEDTVERQMLQIAREEATLGGQISELGLRLEGVGTEAAQLAAARTALEKLSGHLEEPTNWELRRQIIESLVEQVRVDTRNEGGERTAVVTVTYRFCADPILRAPARGRHGAVILVNRAPKLESVLPQRASQDRMCPPAALRATAEAGAHG